MSQLDDLYKRYPLPAWRPIAWTTMLLLAAFVGWSFIAELEEVASTSGEVVPQGKVKLIQHLEGGIVDQILVAEGDAVEEGAPLVRLDLPTTAINREELQVQLDALLLTRARLKTESAGDDLVFPAAESERHPDIVATEKATFDAHRRQLDSRVAALKSRQEQRRLDLAELEAKQRALQNNLRLAREEFAISTRLRERELTPKIEHLQLQRQVEAMEGELKVLVPTIPRARAAIDEAGQRVTEELEQARSRALQDLSRAELDIARLRELLAEATDQRLRTTIRSPIRGVVKNLRYNTIGGVVRPGETIMEIVPADDRLVIAAQLSPADRGYVQVGHTALIKISAYDFFQYGGLEGRVTHIAADTNRAPDGTSYFDVVIETDQSYLDSGGEPLLIQAGMQATVDIKTGTRSVLRYLLKPVLKLKHEAFRER